MVNTVHDFHQLITVASGLNIIEQIQLRNPGRSEIIEHATRFCISMAIHPDPIQRFHRCGYQVVAGFPVMWNLSAALVPAGVCVCSAGSPNILIL